MAITVFVRTSPPTAGSYPAPASVIVYPLRSAPWPARFCIRRNISFMPIVKTEKLLVFEDDGVKAPCDDESQGFLLIFHTMTYSKVVLYRYFEKDFFALFHIHQGSC